MPYKKVTIVVVFLCSLSLFGQDITLSGRVLIVNTTTPIESVNVHLVGTDIYTLTDADGRYTFAGAENRVFRPNTAMPYLQGKHFHITIHDRAQKVSLELFTVSGRRIGEKLQRVLYPGDHTLDITTSYLRTLSHGIYLVKIQVGTQQYLFKGITFANGFRGQYVSAPAPRENSLGRSAAPLDSLHFWKTGYENAVHTVDNFQAVFPDVFLTPGIAFEPYYIGSGKVTDLSTSSTVQIAFADRFHIMIFPDGYMQEDLDLNRYSRDVENYYDDVFSLVPLDFFKEAFVVWMYPVPSPAHVGEGTYFQVPIDVFAGDMNVTAEKSWELIEKFPFTPKNYSGGRPKNMVLQMMIMDPSRGRTGFSGRSTSLRNPNNSSQSVGIAIALSQHHEFMHAFARLSDEYYDLGHGPAGSSETSNLTNSNLCDDLPWKHLLVGGTINPDQDSLIGAFGIDNRYHSEFKCLMNGSHDNAVLYGGSNNLRTSDRLCNWCRELTGYRVYLSTLVLPDASTAWDTWVSSYRMPFYEQFGFYVPDPTPQENSEGTAWFLECIE